MSFAPPRVEPVPLAPAGTLGGDFAAGAGTAGDLFASAGAAGAGRRAPGAADPERNSSARVPAAAFGATTPEARKRLDRVLAGEGILVGTGQQPALLLGPLFVLYKALGAIELAARLEARLGVPALASFWIASDDHDWPEVAATRVLDTEHRPRRFEIAPPAGRERHPVGPTALPPGITAVVDEFIAGLGGAGPGAGRLEALREAYRPGRRFAEAFADALADALGDRDMVWLDAAAPEVKRASRDLLGRALEEGDADAEALALGTSAVVEAGYEPQLALLPGATQVFLETEAGRDRLYRDGAGFRMGREGEPIGRDRLRAIARSEPGRLSPAAALRPVLEAWLVPVGAYVLGPGEIAYWAQLGPLFERYGVPLPAVHARPAWRVLDGTVERVLEKLGAVPEDLAGGGEALIRREVERGRPVAVARALGSLEAALGREMGAVERAVGRELPGIRASVGRAESEIVTALERLQKAVDRRVRDDREATVAQIRKAAAHLFPDGVPQERWLSPYYYLARYGEAFVDRLAEAAFRVAASGARA